MAATENITVLFTDLVGSTELASGLSPEAEDELRRTHFSALRQAIATSGGTEVKNLGDGLMVVFRAASAALGCAVAMQQAIHRRNLRADQALAVRIGISTGEAVAEDGDYFGDPVVQAARLCALAGGGQILMPDVIRFLVGRHISYEFVALGPLELKGLPDPVDTVEIRWQPDADGAESGDPPLPARLASALQSSSLPFSGRGDELAVITAARKRANAGDGLQTVLVAGEPGMGKTTLAANAATLAHDEGSMVLLATCAEEFTVPYQLWITALVALLEHGGDAAADLRPAHAGALARLMPALVDRLPADRTTVEDPDTARFLLLEAVVALLGAASATTPLVLVLDDLQWVDAASLQVLRHLVGAAEPLRVLVMATYRAGDLGRTHPLGAVLADLHRVPSVSRVELNGLDDLAVVGLITSAAGHDLGHHGVEFAHKLRRETGGNPFFVSEMLRHLTESGMVVSDDEGRYQLAAGLDDMGLPNSIRDVVGSRVARLGEEDGRLLSAAAVIGREFDIAVLVRLSATDEDAVLDGLERAVTAALVEEVPGEPGRYRFVHSLVRQTLYEELSATRRQRLHHHVAEVLEESATPTLVDASRLAELARHWQAATRPTDDAKALDYTMRAGDAAMASLAPADAVTWYTQALELAARQPAPDDRQRCELLLRLGGAELQFDPATGFETLRRAGDLAEKIGSTDLLIKWAHIRPPGWRASEPPDPDRLRRLNQVLAVVDADDHALRARLLAAVAEETDPAEWRRRRQVADEAVAAAMEADDDATTVDVIMSTSFITLSPDRAREHVELAKKVLAISETHTDPVILAGSLHFMVTASLVVGDVDAARRAVDQLSALAEVYGSPLVLSLLHQTIVCLHMLEGDLDALERHAESMLALGLGAGMPAMVAAYGGALFEMRWAQGRLAEIADMAAAALDDLPSYSGFRAAVVVVYCATGQLDLARAVFSPEAAADFAEFPFDQIWLACMALFSEGAVALGDARAQATLHDRLVPFADLHAAGGPIFYGSMQRPVGRLAAALGRPDEAEERLRLALNEHRRIGASFWLARTAVELAEVLLDSPTPDPDGGRRRQEARSLLQEARQLAGDRYGEVAARAEELMAAPGMAAP